MSFNELKSYPRLIKKPDYCRRGWNECFKKSERSSRHNRLITSCSSAALSSNADGYFGREELDNCISHSNGFEPAQGKERLILIINRFLLYKFQAFPPAFDKNKNKWFSFYEFLIIVWFAKKVKNWLTFI